MAQLAAKRRCLKGLKLEADSVTSMVCATTDQVGGNRSPWPCVATFGPSLTLRMLQQCRSCMVGSFGDIPTVCSMNAGPAGHTAIGY